VVGAAGAAGAVADLPNILNMTVPQVGHLPLMALRPFFIVSSRPLEISFLALHLTQYPSAINFLPVALHAFYGGGTVTASITKVNSKGKLIDIEGFKSVALTAVQGKFKNAQALSTGSDTTDCNRARR